MDAIELLRKKGDEIVDEATDTILGSHLRHYENADPAQTRARLNALFDLTLECLMTKSVTPAIKYAETIAQQRFSSGFSLREMQTSCNVLEETIWRHILDEMKPNEYARAVMQVDTPLRIGKESIARMYFSFLSKSKAGALSDLPAHLTGREIV